MNGIVDADTHVIESEAIWAHFDSKLTHRRPVALVQPYPKGGKGHRLM